MWTGSLERTSTFRIVAKFSSEQLQEALLYFGSAAVSLVLLWSRVALIGKDWSVPFFSPLAGDTLFHAVLVKSVIQNGWYLFNPLLGAPTGSALYDFKYAPTLHAAAFKILSLFSNDFGVVFNVYFVLTFPLATLTALFAFRNFGLARLPAFTASVLFAYLPFHVLRGQYHLYVAYYMVPLGCIAALWLWEVEWTQRRVAVATLMCAALSFDLPYWPFFTAFVLAVAGICAAVENKATRPLKIAGLLLGVILVCSALNLAPNFLYSLQHGSNPGALVRVPAEAELYGLKIVQMLLPVRNHRFPPFRRLQERYDSAAPLVNENSTAALGVVASVGFCVLLLMAFVETPLCTRWPVLRRLVRLNLAAVLLGTVGGFSSLFAFTLFAQIRCYNRISVLIGFLSLFAVGILLTEARRRVPVWAGWLLCLGLVAFGLLDQIPRNVDFYSKNLAKMANGRRFVRQIQTSLPKGAMVFELPYLQYPEGGNVGGMSDYEPLSPYLYSNNLKWSYGAIKGRSDDARQRQVALSTAPEMLDAIALMGFRGIYIDRDGYSDNARALESALGSMLTEQPLVSSDSRLTFFDLAPARARLERELDGPNGTELLGHLLSRLAVWSPGCYDSEQDSTRQSRWCGGRVELELENPFSRPLPIAIQMRFSALGQERAEFVVEGPSGQQKLVVSSSGTPFQMDFIAPPGHQVLRVSCNGAPVNAPNDPRVMVFSVQQFHIQPK